MTLSGKEMGAKSCTSDAESNGPSCEALQQDDNCNVENTMSSIKYMLSIMHHCIRYMTLVIMKNKGFQLGAMEALGM